MSNFDDIIKYVQNRHQSSMEEENLTIVARPAEAPEIHCLKLPRAEVLIASSRDRHSRGGILPAQRLRNFEYAIVGDRQKSFNGALRAGF